MCVEMWKYVYGARYLLRCARVWMQALLPFKFQLSVQTNEQPKNIHTKIPIFLSLSVCLIPDANDFPVAITNHIHDDKHDICWFKFLGQPRQASGGEKKRYERWWVWFGSSMSWAILLTMIRAMHYIQSCSLSFTLSLLLLFNILPSFKRIFPLCSVNWHRFYGSEVEHNNKIDMVDML